MLLELPNCTHQRSDILADGRGTVPAEDLTFDFVQLHYAQGLAQRSLAPTNIVVRNPTDIGHPT
jgi:hypothetical protein